MAEPDGRALTDALQPEWGGLWPSVPQNREKGQEVSNHHGTKVINVRTGEQEPRGQKGISANSYITRVRGPSGGGGPFPALFNQIRISQTQDEHAHSLNRNGLAS